MKDGTNKVEGIRPSTFPVVLSPDVFALDPERKVILGEGHHEQPDRPVRAWDLGSHSDVARR